MPISIRIEAETGVAIATASGLLGGDTAREAAAQLWSSRDWPGTAALWDFRAAEFDVSSAEIRLLARYVLDHQPDPAPAKMAFVTARDVDFGMARMFEVFRQDPGTAFRVFRDYDEAIAWARSREPAPA